MATPESRLTYIKYALFFYNFLGVYGILCIVACIFELAGAAYILDNSTIWSKGTFWLKDRFYQLIYETQRDNRAYEIMRVIQEHVQCCGSYKYYDYSDVHIPIPNECRNQITGNVHKYGCHEIFSHYLSTRSGPLAGVALALFILQVIAAFSAFHMRSLIRRVERGETNYKRVSSKG
ncbi:hypothetical protein QYM36_011210 [Artemia franciscana]|uniref:Tetraspanin n=1 Tax=Artemia franciscana TaxID=6661 RepID=A0AA88HP01_ARTSF|nr:hypothetical protein QYM36_011210 [Artemia franciscana]